MDTKSILEEYGLTEKEAQVYLKLLPLGKINDIDEKKKLILSVLPELESLKKEIKESSNVEIYEGFKGISTILSDIFRTKQQTYYFGSYSKSLEILRHL